MKNSLFKKSFVLLLAVLMLFTAVPAGVFAAEKDLPVIKAFTSVTGDFHAYKTEIVTVTFLDYIDEAEYAACSPYAWDISASSETGTVKAWMKVNAEETAAAGATRYDVYIGGFGGVAANAYSADLFWNFKKLKRIDGLEKFDTSNATNFSYMFNMCESLESLDLSSWDTSNVTTFLWMFNTCHKLKELNLSGWDTSSATNMNSMFKNCKSITELDISSFDTSKVTNMNSMFYNCIVLADLYVGEGWNIENVTDGAQAFNCCDALPGFDPQNSQGSIDYADKYVKPVEQKPQAKKYTVTYEFIGDVIPEGVTAPEAATYDEGISVTVADNSSAEHYVFSGWKTEDAEVVNGEFVINNDVHFVGKWSKLYTVTYKYDKRYEVPAGAPELPATAYYKAGDTVDVSWPPYVERYIFIGWSTEDADVAGYMFDMPEKDVVLYGYFKIPVESIEILDTEDLVINQGDKTTLNVYVKPEDATIKTVIYESSDESVVTIDKYNNIIAVGEGTATVTVKSADDETKSDTITVNVKKPVTEIGVTPAEVTLKKGETEKLTVYVNEDATNKEVTFTSNDESVATVDENGRIIAVGDGEATITVVSKDDAAKFVTVKVTVKTPVTEIVAPEEITLEVNESAEIDAKVNDDATNKELVYETSDPGVARVDSTGVVIGVSEGAAIITVTSKDNPSVVEYVPVTVYKKYNVTYEYEGELPEGAPALPVSEAYKSDERVEVKTAPVLDGYEFTGWTTTDAELADGSFTMPSRDVVLKGSFKKINYYDVAYKYTGEVPENAPAVPGEEAYKEGSTVNVKADAVLDGYTFSGWGTTDADVKNGSFEIHNDVEFIGSWEKIFIPVDKITVDKTEITLDEGEKDKITVTVTPDDATDKSVTYESSNEKVVKVDENGNITAVGKGEAIITVKTNDGTEKEVTVKVTVEKPVTGIMIENPDIDITVGDEEAIKATVIPEDATDNRLIYTSENPDIATVDKNGKITALKEGMATITVVSQDNPELKGEVTVTVRKPYIPVDSIIITGPSDVELQPGVNYPVTVIVNPNDATDKGVIFESSNPDVAVVDQKGNVTAVKEGTAVITVISKGDSTKTDTITVTVKNPYVPVESVVVDKNKITMEKGDTDKINASVKPDNATDKEVTYKSSDESVVKVDENGNIEAVGEGTAVIRVTSKDKIHIYREVWIEVKPETVHVTDIIVSESTVELEAGTSHSLTVTVSPDNATDKDVIYTSSNESIVTVDKDGKIIAKSEGTATVTITSKANPEVKETVTVTVKPPKNPGHTIVVPEGVNINEGETKNLGVIITPDDGIIKPVYKSGDESIVTVDAEGNITGIKAGATTITVDFGNGDVRVIPVVVVETVIIPVKHYVCFGKTDGIGWYEVSVNGGDFFPQGPNSTLEVEEGSVLVVRVQDMWIDDEFDFYVNGSKVPMDPANTITVVVDGYMLIGALSMDVEVPDVDESLTIFEKITNFFAKIINWFKDLFTW